MIAACPTCGARYRIDTAKLRPEGARLRCSRCESVFRVRAPGQSEEAPPPVAREEAPSPTPRREAPQPSPSPTPRREAPQPSPSPTPRREAPQPTPSPTPRREAPQPTPSPVVRQPAKTALPAAPPPTDAVSFDRERLVLVAHPETEAGKAVADALGSWGLQTILVHDGVEAILNIQRALPRVVVLDAALPKMFGFQICELMKRNESLRDIHVVLVGAIHDQGRYRRPPGELYGADEYIERQNLPDGLAPLLERFGLSGARAPQAAATQPQPSAPATTPPAPAPQPVPVPQPRMPEPTAPPAPKPAPAASSDPALAAEIEQADRLARIIVSDIVLYNPERFEEGLRTGNVAQALGAELEEGRALFAQRVDPRAGAPEEFLHRELMRVARSRGMSE